MVNDLIDGISIALNSEFGDIPIYSEEVSQGLAKPCFFIATIDAKEEPLLGNRALRRSTFDIHYFPKNGNADCHSVAFRLCIALRFIDLLDGSKANGRELNWEIIDGVLHFFVQYTVTVYYTEEPAELQGDLSHSVEVD